MAWNAEYWDLMTNLYWAPDKIGCRRIIDLCESCQKKRPAKNLRSPDNVIGRLQRLEEPLNDIFNLFLRIAPGRFPCTIFGPAFTVPFDERFEFLGQEIGDRYGFGNANITQQDVFLVGDQTLLMIELKVAAHTDLLQVAKYALLAALEERETGRRDQLLLLYLTPEKPFHKFWKEGFSNRGEMLEALRYYNPALTEKKLLAKVFTDHHQTVADVMGRMEIGFMTYEGLANILTIERDRLDPTTMGDETLIRLIDGLLAELRARNLALAAETGR